MSSIKSSENKSRYTTDASMMAGHNETIQHSKSFKNKPKQTLYASQDNQLSNELKDAIRHMVSNISKSFIVEWYTSISPTNHDFVASCESLIEEVMLKIACLMTTKLDKYKIGQLITTLLHDHVLSEKSTDKRQSIDHQIDNYEYDICQSLVVRLFGLATDENLRQVVFTTISNITSANVKPKNDLNNYHNNGDFHRHHCSNNQQYSRKFTNRTSGAYPKSFSFEDIILGSSTKSSSSSLSSSSTSNQQPTAPIKTTSALYTLVIAMLTKAAFMPIISSISEPRWLYAVIIWLCKKDEREQTNNRSLLAKDASRSCDRRKSYINKSFKLSRDANLVLNPSLTQIVITDTKGYRTLDLEEGFDIASANINFENPICGSLKRPLDNIEIFATEEVKTQNSCYVLYCIRYDGLCYRHPSAGGFSFIPDHPDVPVIDKRQTHSVRRRNETNIRSTNMTNPGDQSVANRKSFRRCMIIKRRFREFVLLQLRLEENPKIRPYIKNIPKPTKLKAATQNIFSLPGINSIKLDQSTIKLRQRFLERFLNALNSSPFIANSYEFKEFFSYNLNPNVSSKSKSTILQVNLNKVFVDSVRSAFSIIRSTLPGDDYQSLNTNSKANPDAWLTELQQSTLKLHVQTRTSHSKMNLERYIDSKLSTLGESPTRWKKCSSLERPSQLKSAYDLTGGSRGGSLKVDMLERHSSSSISNSDSTPAFMSRSSSSNSQQQQQEYLSMHQKSKRDSSDSIYYDASCNLDGEAEAEVAEQTSCNPIQICDNYPMASKFIEIIHYSISKNPFCAKSPFSFMARLMLGRLIEKYAIQMLEVLVTMKSAAFSINCITSSIWDESDDPPLDLDNANLDEAVIHLTKLIERNYASHTFVPKKILSKLISNQMHFYLSQLESQKRNKFVIYSFLVHLLDELEIIDQ